MSTPWWGIGPNDEAPDGPEEMSEHDLYMELVMEDEPFDGHPHDWEPLVEGDRVYGEVCVHCDVQTGAAA